MGTEIHVSHKILTPCIVILLLMILSCSEKGRNLRWLEDFTATMELEHSSYTPEDWEAAAEEFSELDEAIQLCDYTDDELAEIGRLKGQCAAYFAKSGLEISSDIAHDYLHEVGGAIKGFYHALTDKNNENNESDE